MVKQSIYRVVEMLMITAEGIAAEVSTIKVLIHGYVFSMVAISTVNIIVYATWKILLYGKFKRADSFLIDVEGIESYTK